MDEQAQTPAPETQAPAAPVEPTTPDPAPETEAPAAPVEPTTPDPAPEAPAESLLDQLESEAVEAAQEVVTAAENVIHAVERRSFGRPSADHPVTVTTVFGGQ